MTHRRSTVVALLLPLACHPAEVRTGPSPDSSLSPVRPSAAPASAAPIESSSTGPMVSVAPGASVPPSTGQPAASALTTGSCQIVVRELLEAEVLRGVRDSPARDDSRSRLSSADRERRDGEEHAEVHLRCRYAVSLDGRPYTYDHVAGHSFVMRHDLDPARCRDPDEQRKVEAFLRTTTHQCADPHAGAYWGFDLREGRP